MIPRTPAPESTPRMYKPAQSASQSCSITLFAAILGLFGWRFFFTIVVVADACFSVRILFFRLLFLGAISLFFRFLWDQWLLVRFLIGGIFFSSIFVVIAFVVLGFARAIIILVAIFLVLAVAFFLHDRQRQPAFASRLH